MADDPQKTVFISYRRKVSFGIAGRISDNLRANGYDVFMDVTNLDAGKFNPAILSEIETRTHFLVILEVGSLNRCLEEGDWLRLEIEHAMGHKRNIVPIMVERFKFSKWMQRYLTGKLSELPRYNALPLSHFFFEAAMEILRERFLKESPDGPISLTPRDEEAVVQQKVEENIEQPKSKRELSAKEYFERGLARFHQGDYEGAIADNNEAIRLSPRYAAAYNNQGLARYYQGDMEGAMADYNEAIRLNPRDAFAYNNRGALRGDLGDLEGAIADCNEAIRLNPQFAEAYNSRGSEYDKKGDYQRALADYNEALRLNPQFRVARTNRDTLLKKIGRE